MWGLATLKLSNLGVVGVVQREITFSSGGLGTVNEIAHSRPFPVVALGTIHPNFEEAPSGRPA